ncbi:MAG: hypothetical protein P8M20_09045, partial [Planctomycetaceae bacterium]|nr:hypothetical protein [Planctomycetaceae bacterium]
MLTLGRSWLLPALMVIMVMALPMSSLMAQDDAGGEVPDATAVEGEDAPDATSTDDAPAEEAAPAEEESAGPDATALLLRVDNLWIMIAGMLVFIM